MKTSSLKKKIIVIWDFDGPIGQINSSYPYNFQSIRFSEELDNVAYLLSYLKEAGISNTFAITGLSAEKGPYPFMFPDLIQTLAEAGHEIASHTWRHEWIPLFTADQIDKSLKRSRFALQEAINQQQPVLGFVPPFNRPMTWLADGNFSAGDRGWFPWFKTADNGFLFKLLEKNGYGWVRISNKSLANRLHIKPRLLTGRVRRVNKLLVLENHYVGFDQKIIDYIINTPADTYTVSAHPLMLSKAGKTESKENFERFVQFFLAHNDTFEFVTPSQLLHEK